MIEETLFHVLTGIDPKARLKGGRDPNTGLGNGFFINEGHVMEFYPIGGGKRAISLFFGPKEFVLPSHPFLSAIVALDDMEIGKVEHGDMLRILRDHPSAHKYYRHIQLEQKRKEGERVYSIRHMTAEQRFLQLKEKQPWVLDIVPEEDVANYLLISMKMLKGFRG